MNLNEITKKQFIKRLKNPARESILSSIRSTRQRFKEHGIKRVKLNYLKDTGPGDFWKFNIMVALPDSMLEFPIGVRREKARSLSITLEQITEEEFAKNGFVISSDSPMYDLNPEKNDASFVVWVAPRSVL